MGLIVVNYLSLALGKKVCVVGIWVSIGDDGGHGGLGDNGCCDLDLLHHRDGGGGVVGVGQGSAVDTVVVDAVVDVVVDTVVTGVVEVSVQESRVSLSLDIQDTGLEIV